MKNEPSALGRIEALDGLRGLAVSAVIVNHLRPHALKGGWLGVDVFFVLSGFLITSLLLAEHRATGRVDIRRFYSRRARRLLPALFLLLLVLTIVARVAPDASGFQSLRGDGLSALGYVANWHFVLAGTSYFAAFAPSALRHLWSLSVEEQFYLLWPLALVVVLRRHGARAVGIVAFGLALASAIAMAVAYGNGTHISRAYFGTDTHAHGVLLGCVLATLGPARRRWPFARTAALLALATLGVCMFVLDGGAPAAYRGGIAGIGVVTAVLIAGLVAAGDSGPAGRMLAWSPLRGLGRISYGLYLWHWPVLVFLTPARVGVSGWPLIVVQLGCTFAFAVASFFLIERPVLTGWPRPRWSWVGVPAAATAAVVMLAIVVPSVPAPFAFAQQQSRERSADTARLPPRALAQTSRPRDDRRRVVVLGDSVAYTLFPGLRAHERAAHLYFLTAAETGCPLDIAATEYRHEGEPLLPANLPEYCDWPRVWPPMIERTKPDVVVALWGLWDVYDHEVGGRWLTVGSRAWAAHMEQSLEQALAIVTARGARMVVLTTPYLIGVPDTRVNALDDVFRRVAARHPDRLTVVDVERAMKRLDPARWDGVHFTAKGADLLGAVIVPQIARIAGENRRIADLRTTHHSSPDTAAWPSLHGNGL
jgi:peptidoglycan/LPS O-acetylase OafA/YrhL